MLSQQKMYCRLSLSISIMLFLILFPSLLLGQSCIVSEKIRDYLISYNRDEGMKSNLMIYCCNDTSLILDTGSSDKDVKQHNN